MRAPFAPGRYRRRARCASFLGGLLGLVVLAPAPAARADVRAMAEALYDEGRQLMAAGRTAEACAKFDASYRIAPATGALLNLATCNETLGNTATAWAQFRTAAASARRDGRPDRVEFAQQHITTLEGILCYLTIVVPPEVAAGSPQISLDGAQLGAAAWNVPVPVDPGSHRLLVSGRGEFPFVVRPGERAVRLDLARVGGGTAAPAPGAPPPAGEPTGPPRPSRVAAFIAAGASVGGLGLGSYFGLRAFSEWKRFEDDCAAPTGCPAGVGDPMGNARRFARLSDVMFGVGAAAGVAAGVLFYLSRTPEAAPPDGPVRAAPARSVLMPAVSANGVGLDWSLRW